MDMMITRHQGGTRRDEKRRDGLESTENDGGFGDRFARSWSTVTFHEE